MAAAQATRRAAAVGRELWLAAAITAPLAFLLLSFGPAPGDAAAHLYRTLLVRHGALVWDNYWYGGSYPLASYSLLYYLPAALVGNLPLVLGAAVASTILFAAIALREWGEAARWPVRVFGVLAAAPVVTGLYSYSLGFATMLGVIRALQGRRTLLAIALGVLTIGFSPLAFAFLCLIVVSAFVARRRFSRRALAVAVGLAAAAAVELAALLLFPTSGVYPFHWADLVGVLLTTALGTHLARRARGGVVLAWFYVLWGLGSILFFCIRSPVGDNWTRLDAFVFPLMLLTAALADFRPRRLTVLALAVALVYNVAPYVLLIPLRLDNRPAHAAYWRPAIDFLRRRLGTAYRVEVVPTAAHWESYWIPKAGFPLARGWYQQLDEADNPLLYSHHLGAAPYRDWLRANAVEYVLLAPTRLDPNGGSAEARLLRSGRSGLVREPLGSSWSVYVLPHPTPLLTGPGPARVTYFGHTAIRGTVSSAGSYLLRVHYNPYWVVSGGGCALRTRDKMTRVELTRPGAFVVRVPASTDGLIDAATQHRRC